MNDISIGIVLCIIGQMVLVAGLQLFGYTMHITRPKPKKSPREQLRKHMLSDGLTRTEAEDICNRMSDEEVRTAIESYIKIPRT